MAIILSKEKIISGLEKILTENEINNLIYAEDAINRNLDITKGQFFKWPRFSWHISGELNMTYSSQNKIVNHHSKKGEIIFFRPFAYNTFPIVANSCGLSVVLHPDYLRLVISTGSGRDGRYKSDGCFYHIDNLYCMASQAAIYTVDAMAEHHDYKNMTIQMLKLTLKIILEDLKKSKERYHGKAYNKWSQIVAFIMENYTANISRKDIATELEVTPAYISKLFVLFANTSFPQYLNLLRLEHAEYLLKNSKLTLDEISLQCGYNYTSYFLRAFKNKNKLSPNQYRHFFKNSIINSKLV